MECSYCGKTIETKDYVKVNSKYFCNNLCKYCYEKEGNEFIDKEKKKGKRGWLEIDDLKFPIEIPDYSPNQVYIQGNIYGKPKLFVNNKKVKATKNNPFSRKKTFEIIDNNGNVNQIVTKNRIFDAVPEVKINGCDIVLESKLKWYEYIWLIIPGMLMFFGGAIGGIIGLAGTYVNTILFRKLDSKIAKYLLTGINSFLAYFIFFKIALFISPILEEIQFNYLQFSNDEIVQMDKTYQDRFNILTSTAWYFKGFYDANGQDITPSNTILRDARRYFYKNGNLTIVLYDGSIGKGKWSFANNYDSIKIEFGEEIETNKIIALSESEFTVEYLNARMVHKPFHFGIDTIF